MSEPDCVKSAAYFSGMLLAIFLPSAGQAADETRAAQGWELGARLFFNEAARSFSNSAPKPDQALGRAVMLLGAQPRTGANLQEARSLLTTLVDSGRGDESEIAARYYLARLEQLHAEKPDLPKARIHYRELASRYPTHLFGQLARLKLAMLALYDSSRPEPLAARIPEALSWGTGISDPVVSCDYHYMMSRALARENGREEQRLNHLLAMEATGQVIRDPTRSLMWVEIGEMARTLGQWELAARAYRTFVAEFPRDARIPAIRTRLSEVESRR